VEKRAKNGAPGAAAAADDGDAFERLYDEQAGAVYRTALRVLGNPTQAQDVVQDVFMRLWHHPERFDGTRGTLPGYLRVMARSRALDIWREGQVAVRARDRLKAVALCTEPRADESPALAAELHRDQAVVLAALARLPGPQRQAIVMAYWGGLTAEEIAVRSGVALGTVKSRIRLGLHGLRERCECRLAADLPVAA
jgi:RNA polymerase sigma-70 factor (ECF subfamily)